MRILLAPDSYKECMDAACVAAAMADAVRQVRPEWETVEMPLADGGEGTVDVLVRALGGNLFSRTVTGPLGQPVEAFYGVAGDVAILEVAAACGLGLVPPDRRNPLLTTTRGVGELLLAALEQGCRHIVIGLGGSATCDGGAGMLSVSGLVERAAGADIEVLCDVDTHLIGPQGAARDLALEALDEIKGTAEEAAAKALAEAAGAIPFVSVEEKPTFNGGDANDFSKWVNQNIQYPAVAQEKGVEGRVVLGFVVDENGQVKDVKVLKGVDPALDAEAVRVVSASPKWAAGKQNGQAAKVSYTFPVVFKLN